FSFSAPPPDLPSFPTRRSSDLLDLLFVHPACHLFTVTCDKRDSVLLAQKLQYIYYVFVFLSCNALQFSDKLLIHENLSYTTHVQLSNYHYNIDTPILLPDGGI